MVKKFTKKVKIGKKMDYCDDRGMIHPPLPLGQIELNDC